MIGLTTWEIAKGVLELPLFLLVVVLIRSVWSAAFWGVVLSIGRATSSGLDKLRAALWRK